MSTGEKAVEITLAGPDDVERLYPLVSSAMVYDHFTADLLREKLLNIPIPSLERYRTYRADADGEPVGMMQAVSRPDEGRGWLGIFAVPAAQRRRKIATRLLERAERDWWAEGVRDLEVLAIPGNYFTPGLDPRYTEALSFLERHGFERFKDCVNLLGPLAEPLPTAEDETRLAKAGVTIRRATPDDDARLQAFFATEFGDSWLLESRQAMANDPPALHLALRGERIIAFSAHSTQNREWGFFGPMGTLPETRGLGLGRVLLRRCLNDLRDAGHQTAIIPWVGPIAFYSYHANCRVERVFWRYRKTLTSVKHFSP